MMRRAITLPPGAERSPVWPAWPGTPAGYVAGAVAEDTMRETLRLKSKTPPKQTHYSKLKEA